MSRSAVSCRSCGAVLGHTKPSGVFHPDPAAAEATFVDLAQGTTTFRCKACNATTVYRGGRIALEQERRTA